jgi:hypothetical protein
MLQLDEAVLSQNSDEIKDGLTLVEKADSLNRSGGIAQ